MFQSTEEKLSFLLREIVNEKCDNDSDLIEGVYNRKKKSRRIVKAREEVLLSLRAEIWEQTKDKNWKVIRRRLYPGKGWKPISFPKIAKVFGGNHSSWVKMLQKINAQNKEKRNMKEKFALTQDQLEKLLEASKPTPVMYISGGTPIGGTPQDNANAAWRALGEEMGFKWDTVEPIQGGPITEFMAEPL